MKRKLLVAHLALVVLGACAAFPVIAEAANAPDLTYPTGTLLASGSKIKGTNVGNSFKFTNTSGMSFWECSRFELTGSLTKNKGSEIEADVESFGISGTAPEGRCTGSVLPEAEWIFTSGTNGLPWCLRSTSTMKEDEVQIRGGSCTAASRPIRIIQITLLEIPIECVYERTAPMAGTYTTDPEDAVMTFSGAEWVKTAGGAACAAAWKMDMSFTLERDEQTVSPLYIS